MHPYLHETQFAVENIFLLALSEEDTLLALAGNLRRAEAQLNVHQLDFQSSDLNDDFPEAYVMAAFARAAQAHTQVQALQGEVAALQSRLGARQTSVQAMCGAILQIAKQGISFAHGKQSLALPGRSIGTVTVRDIIWQARNQSMHYEEEASRITPAKQQMLRVFATLELEQGPEFSLAQHPQQSRARQILRLLGWRDLASYQSDMHSLLSSAA